MLSRIMSHRDWRLIHGVHVTDSPRFTVMNRIRRTWGARYFGVILLGTFMQSSCGPRRTLPDDGALSDALLSQAWGAGGCNTILAQETIDQPFFPGVEFFRGSCIAEHGDTIHSQAARDSLGVIYSLDSRSGFRFLLIRHPPSGVNSSSVVEYAYIALIYSGNLGADSRLIRRLSEIPDSAAALRDRDPKTVVLSRVQMYPRNLQLVWVTALEEDHLPTFGVLVDSVSGDVTIVHAPADPADRP